MKAPRKYFEPLAIGAPPPYRELPSRVERMIHFIPPHIEKMRAKAAEIAREVDVVLGNLEDAIPIEAKEAAREGFLVMAQSVDFGATGLWARVNALNSPWFLDDMTRLVGEVGNKLDVVMLPKVEGPWDIHFIDQYLAQLEARHGIARPILVHAILETAEGVNNVEAIAAASPRMHGMKSRARRPRRLARHEDHAGRRRTSGLPRARRRGGTWRAAQRGAAGSPGTTRSLAWLTPARRTGSSRFTDLSATSPTPPPARPSSATPS